MLSDTAAPDENRRISHKMLKSITNYFQSTELYMTLSPNAIVAGYFVDQLSAFCNGISEEESSTFFEALITHLFQIATLSVISSGFQKGD